MLSGIGVWQLEDLLRREVAFLCRRDRRHWKEPIVRTIHELRDMGLRAVFFGGTLRSLLVSRLFQGKLGKPRDVDIVIEGASVETLRERFKELVLRETRFGGLQLQRLDWRFDLWPLERTWAFAQDKVTGPEFADLPRTTFFNLEAIAVEVWPYPGRPRAVFSGDGQFFDGIIKRVLELNREENPYPNLGVVRALLLAASNSFRLGPRLSKYIVNIGARMTPNEMEDIQTEHYGRVRQSGGTLLKWINLVADAVTGNENEPVSLPVPQQLSLWSEEHETLRIHMRFLRAKDGAGLSALAHLGLASRQLEHH